MRTQDDSQESQTVRDRLKCFVIRVETEDPHFRFGLREVMAIAYIFKPRTRQVDEVAEVVKELRARGCESLTISRFYEYAAERAIEEYRRNPDSLCRWVDSYQRSQYSSDA